MISIFKVVCVSVLDNSFVEFKFKFPSSLLCYSKCMYKYIKGTPKKNINKGKFSH